MIFHISSDWEAVSLESLRIGMPIDTHNELIDKNNN